MLLATTTEPATLDAMVSRRAAGVPLEQVVGWAEFAGVRVTSAPRGVRAPTSHRGVGTSCGGRDPTRCRCARPVLRDRSHRRRDRRSGPGRTAVGQRCRPGGRAVRAGEPCRVRRRRAARRCGRRGSESPPRRRRRHRGERAVRALGRGATTYRPRRACTSRGPRSTAASTDWACCGGSRRGREYWLRPGGWLFTECALDQADAGRAQYCATRGLIASAAYDSDLEVAIVAGHRPIDGDHLRR